MSFPRTQQRVIFSVGIELAILHLLFGTLTDYAAATEMRACDAVSLGYQYSK